MRCEVTRSAGYDPTGEWAVECGAEGEYCAVCEIVACPHCHKALAADLHYQQKKTTASVITDRHTKTA